MVIAENIIVSCQRLKDQIFGGSTVTPMKDSNKAWCICLRVTCHCENILAVLNVVDGCTEI